MKNRIGAVAFVLFFLSAFGARGHFGAIQIEAVPIDRVLKHFEADLAKNTNDVEALYHLARIHSMAYATDRETVDIQTNNYGDGKIYEPFFGYSDNGTPDSLKDRSDFRDEAPARKHLAAAIGYYQRAAVQIVKSTNGSRWLNPPIHIGLAWCLDQAGRRNEAIKAYREALKISWDLEVGPLPTLKEQTEWSWDQLRAMKNPLSLPPKSLGAGICYSDEIIGYLLGLLDPVKDAREIARLRADRQTLRGMSRAITPIVMSLAPDTSLAELVNPAASVPFDLDGSGFKRRWGWITPRAAWLVFDKTGNDRITSGLQMFGNVTFWIFWRDGYDALSSLDDNGDGMLRGDELRGLSLWHDLNGDGICDPGEVRPVTDWGITEIDCRSQTHATGIPFNPRGIVMRDGTTRATYDWIVESTGPVD